MPLGDDILLGYDQVQRARRSVLDHFGDDLRPEVGIVLGSGLGTLAERLQDGRAMDYAAIDYMPTPTVQGHGGRLIVGRLGNKPVACLSGRVHLYEGHGSDRVVFGVRLLAALGAQVLVVTNAAGGIATECAPGTFVVISDHINLTGNNPLLGANDPRFGERFPDMTRAYDEDLAELATQVARQESIPVQSGVYAGVLGPSYETPAEVRLLAQWGAAAVGMSTVHEVIAARHLKMRVLGISCITNYAAGRAPGELKHEDVARQAQKSADRFCTLVETICSKIA